MPYFVELIVPPRGIRNNKDQEAKYIAACLEEIKQELRQYNLSVKVMILCRNRGFGCIQGESYALCMERHCSRLNEMVLRQMQWPS